MHLILFGLVTAVGICVGDVSHILNQNGNNREAFWWMDKGSPLGLAAQNYHASAIGVQTHSLAGNPFLNGRIHVSDVPTNLLNTDGDFLTGGKASVHKLPVQLSIINLGETGADVNQLGGSSTAKPTRQALYSAPGYLPPIDTSRPPPPSCAPGQQRIGGVCQCVGNTIFQNGQCITPQPQPIRCNYNEHLINGRCVAPQPTPPPRQICPYGQQLVNGNCQIVCPGNTVLQGGRCVPLGTPPPPVVNTPSYLPPTPSCGPNQYPQNGQCINRPSCAPGQQLIGGVCQCTGNTIFQNGRCVVPVQPTPPPYRPAESSNPCSHNQFLSNGICVQCAYHEVFQNGRCVPKATPAPPKRPTDYLPPVSCSYNDILQNGVCVPKPIICSGNTYLQNGVCIQKSTPAPPIICAPNQILQNGRCIQKPVTPQPAPGYSYPTPHPPFALPSTTKQPQIIYTQAPFVPSASGSVNNQYQTKPPQPIICTGNTYLQNGVCVQRPTIRTPTSPGYNYPRPTPAFPLPQQEGDFSNVDNIYISTAKPIYRPDNIPSGNNNNPTFIPPNRNVPEQNQILPGCAAALKCVQEIYCTPAGVVSPVPVIFTKEQEFSRVPVTDCADQEAGIVGKCCRDPDYKDPWPSANLVNGIDNGQYREDPSLGQFTRKVNFR